jgi:hypothetical protein
MPARPPFRGWEANSLVKRKSKMRYVEIAASGVVALAAQVLVVAVVLI